MNVCSVFWLNASYQSFTLSCSTSEINLTAKLYRIKYLFDGVSVPRESLSSSSSLARQPYVGPGLPQKLLPAEVSGYCFFIFRDNSISRVGLSAPRPTPGYPGVSIFSVKVISLSRPILILKRQDLAFCPCMT
jgi:hypothetical protein